MINLKGKTSVADIADGLEMSVDDCRVALQDLYQKSVFLYGVQPFTLQFESESGWTIRNTSAVGLISDGRLTMSLEPKIPNVSISKLLRLSQEFGGSSLRISDKRLLAAYESTDEIASMDLMATSLCDAVSSIIRLGILAKYSEEIERDLALRGGIALEESISEGSMRPPLTHVGFRDERIDCNSVIAAALSKARGSVRAKSLQAELEYLITEFPKVYLLREKFWDTANLEEFVPSNRVDYRTAIAMSIAILNGDSVDSTSGDAIVPQCIMDLDLLFEEVCAGSLKRLLNPERFEVLYNSKHPHPTLPEMPGFYKPDITVRDKSSGKTVVLDAKNKYSSRDATGPTISNPDLFQISYYGLSLQSPAVVLLYPSGSPLFQFPIQGSEGFDRYEAKVRTSLASEKLNQYQVALGSNNLSLMTYEIQLSGSVHDTWESAASLASLIAAILGDLGPS